MTTNAAASTSLLNVTSGAAQVEPASATAAPGMVSGAPRLLLRVESLITLLGAAAAYRALGGSWAQFALWFFVPDLSMLGYLVNPRVGAILYNAGHSLILPALLAVVGLVAGSSAALLAACIWVAHIGFDRMAGYGLKASATSFFDTHLGRVGRSQPRR